VRVTRAAALRIFEDALMRRNFAASTIALSRDVVGKFLRAAGTSARRVKRSHVRQYLASRARSVCANSTARELEVIRAFFTSLADAGQVARDPTEGLAVARGPTKPPLLLSEEDVERLFAAASVEPRSSRLPAVRRAVALRNRAVLELFYGAGLRLSEVAALLVVDVALDDGAVLCRRAKRGAPRYLPLPPASVAHVARYVREGRPHLVREGRDQGRLLLTEAGRPWHARRIYATVRRIAARAGLKAHPHAFRRAVATHLVRNGASVVAVRELLGHVRLETTQRYVEVDPADLRRAVEALDADGVLRRSRPS
jgi:site-specific recombinase XerD